MIFKRFLEFFPEIAEKETRRITLRNDPKIPDGEYAFVDSFCEDADCDCRRVYFDVLQIDPDYEPIHVARISYGWEDLDFYLSWSPYIPSNMATENEPNILTFVNNYIKCPRITPGLRIIPGLKLYPLSLFPEKGLRDEDLRPEVGHRLEDITCFGNPYFAVTVHIPV
jgi:hypothetical protein